MWVYIFNTTKEYDKLRVNKLLEKHELPSFLTPTDSTMSWRYESDERLPREVLTDFGAINPGMAGYTEIEIKPVTPVPLPRKLFGGGID